MILCNFGERIVELRKSEACRYVHRRKGVCVCVCVVAWFFLLSSGRRNPSILLTELTEVPPITLYPSHNAHWLRAATHMDLIACGTDLDIIYLPTHRPEK